jgi:FkbM family methyltransferase
LRSGALPRIIESGFSRTPSAYDISENQHFGENKLTAKAFLRNSIWNTSRRIVNTRSRIAHLLYILSDIYIQAHKNLNYDMATNGEFLLLSRLSKHEIKVVFDVGANIGDYTKECLSVFPKASIHSFEIVPKTFEKLTSNVGHSERVTINNIGLSNASGTLEINYNPDDDGKSSIIEGASIHSAKWQKLQVDTITGDSYVTRADISQIDLLKMDVEGAEHLVLNGLSETLSAGKIRTIQFEFGMVNIYSKFLLKDYWSLLSGYGFTIGPIMPDGVAFMDYDPYNEDFHGPPNFFAVHKSQSPIITDVRRP